MKDAKSIFAQTFIYLEMQKDILVFVPEALVIFFLNLSQTSPYVPLVLLCIIEHLEDFQVIKDDR